jgi:hypothetical protein
MVGDGYREFGEVKLEVAGLVLQKEATQCIIVTVCKFRRMRLFVLM